MLFRLLVLLIISLNVFAQQPPVAKAKTQTLAQHGDTRTDDFAWMKNKNSGAFKKYLKAEQKYTDAVMADTKPLQEKLYDELLGRVKQTDMSVPYRYKTYWYYLRYTEGENYPVYCRKAGDLDADEQVILDANKVVKEEKCYSAYPLRYSYDNNLMAYAIDKTGNFESTVFFKEMKTGNKLKDVLHKVTSLAFAADNRMVFYTVQEPKTNRSYRLYKHVLGNDTGKDELIYEEKDKQFDLYVYSTKAEEFIFLMASSADETEVRFLSAKNPDEPFRIIHPRERKNEYFVSHYQDKFYIRTNKDAINFKLVTAPVSNPAIENWETLTEHREEVLLDRVDIYNDFMVLNERTHGNDRVQIRWWNTGESFYVPVEEEVYSFGGGYNPDFDAKWLRFYFSSLKTPLMIFEFNVHTLEKKILKQWEIPSGHNSDDYVTEKVFATAPDGKQVPISLLYKKGLEKNGSNPVYMEAYGAYGEPFDAGYVNTIYPLVDRGFIYAIAHVRGGDDMGRVWYHDGKMLNKKNTFTDFIASTEHLIAEQYTASGMVVAQGASAGGLLMGAIANMRPDLYKGVILHVPFVDVLNTILDTLLPLSTQEFIEWGNPYIKEEYDYIKSYSPYDNVKRQDYPHLLFTSGVTDEQVGVWEPAKMVAKLRALKTDNNLLLFKITFKGGHSGPSGRYPYYEDLAFEYAFVLKIFGME